MEELETPPADAFTAEAYPEGGAKAYSVTLGAWLALLPASGLLNSMGVLQAYLSENQLATHSESQLGWIFSTYAFLFFFGGLQVGPLFDRYGLSTLLPVGAAGLVLSLLCTSFCDTYYQFILAFSILGGVASSILWTSSIATIGHWFQWNRGLATGLATTAGGFGGVFLPILFNHLTPKIGFSWSIRCFALFSTICFLISLLLLRTRLPRNRQARLMLDWGGFRDSRFLLTMLAIFILDWAVLVPPAYLTSYTSSSGLMNISPHILVILNASSIFGRGIPGVVADRVGRFNTMVVCLAACTCSIFGLWLNAGSSAATTITFAILYGFFSGSAYSLTPVCVAQLCRAEDFATRYGTAYGVVSLATLCGVPISGSILTTGEGPGENYHALILFCGVAYALSTGAFIAARGLSGGWNVFVQF